VTVLCVAALRPKLPDLLTLIVTRMIVVTTVANCMHKETKQKGLIFYFEMTSTNERKLKLRKRRSQEIEEMKRLNFLHQPMHFYIQ